MNKALTDLVLPFLEKLGVDTVTKRMRLLRKVDNYLEQDREHFVEIENPEDPPFTSTPENGLVGKLAPLAQRMQVEEDEHHMECITETVSVMVTTGGNTLLLYSIERAHLSKADNDWSFRFPTYRLVEPGLFLEGLEAHSPEKLRPIATDLSWEAYCMVFYAYERITRHLHPSYVPHKTERAMLVLKHTTEETYTVKDTVYRGRLVPLAIDADSALLMEEDSGINQTTQLCLLVTDRDARYLIETTTVHPPSKDLPGGNDPLDILTPPQAPQVTEVYQEIALENISTQFFALYN